MDIDKTPRLLLFVLINNMTIYVIKMEGMMLVGTGMRLDQSPIVSNVDQMLSSNSVFTDPFSRLTAGLRGCA